MDETKIDTSSSVSEKFFEVKVRDGYSEEIPICAVRCLLLVRDGRWETMRIEAKRSLINSWVCEHTAGKNHRYHWMSTHRG